MGDRKFRLSGADLDRAFDNDEFALAWQPKVDVATGRVLGAEAFVRWQHPRHGLLLPGLFLALVEAEGRVPDLAGFVFNDGLAAARRWMAEGRDWTLSLNVGPETVTASDFTEALAALLQDYGVEPARLVIELPERAIVGELARLSEALGEVRRLGVHVALDGGGIVPADLDTLPAMPFTAVKIGGPASIRLAQRLGPDGRGAIATRLRQARRQGLEAVAVGVEDEATMAGLAAIGFTAAQGIWIHPPMTLDDLLGWDGTWARHDGRAHRHPAPAPAPAAAPEPVDAAAPAEAPTALAHRPSGLKPRRPAVATGNLQQAS
jgi:EAL domain-containing protein (putative c-di-GMP-specific phosphodiesterase class I)